MFNGGLNAFKQGFKGEAKYLKGKESLSDYQEKHKEEEIGQATKDLREALLRM